MGTIGAAEGCGAPGLSAEELEILMQVRLQRFCASRLGSEDRLVRVVERGGDGRWRQRERQRDGVGSANGGTLVEGSSGSCPLEGTVALKLIVSGHLVPLAAPALAAQPPEHAKSGNAVYLALTPVRSQSAALPKLLPLSDPFLPQLTPHLCRGRRRACSARLRTSLPTPRQSPSTLTTRWSWASSTH
eukprot:1145123-Pleurochrysis_carterae.AAC.1